MISPIIIAHTNLPPLTFVTKLGLSLTIHFNTLLMFHYIVIFSQDFAETAMNELLGWYGYSNVDRNDLTKCSRFPTTTVHLEADLVSPTSTHHARQMRLLNTTATTTATSSVAAPSSRTTNSTPDRCNNSTSPESSDRHSKSPNVTILTTTKLNDKQGLL